MWNVIRELVADVQNGRRDSSPGQLLRAATPVLGQLILVGIVAGIGIVIGFVLIIVPGLFLITIWSVAAPVVVLEHPGVLPALRRSRLFRTQPGEPKPPRIRNMDRANPRRLRCDIPPDAETLKNAATGVAQRGSPIIKARLRTRPRCDPLDEQHIDTKPPERQRETRANHPSTDNSDIDLHRGFTPPP